MEDYIKSDIKNGMLETVKNLPINNEGTFPLSILWRVFEFAYENHFEEWEQLSKIPDSEVEEVFHELFPEFIANYPRVLVLDGGV